MRYKRPFHPQNGRLDLQALPAGGPIIKQPGSFLCLKTYFYPRRGSASCLHQLNSLDQACLQDWDDIVVSVRVSTMDLGFTSLLMMSKAMPPSQILNGFKHVLHVQISSTSKQVSNQPITLPKVHPLEKSGPSPKHHHTHTLVWGVELAAACDQNYWKQLIDTAVPVQKTVFFLSLKTIHHRG